MNGLLSPTVIVQYLLRAVVVLITIPFHESAHALASHLLGDDTAVCAGRLSMNPLRHFDPLGALCMLVGGVGWAKPVSINPYNYKNPKVGWYSGLGDAVPVLTMFLYYMVAMNLSLAVFNLLPVPPFDGSRIALLFLPQRLYFRAMKYERYIMLAVLALVFLGLLDAPLSWLVNGMWRLMLHMTGFVELLWGY